jgi:hypothetical protein
MYCIVSTYQAGGPRCFTGRVVGENIKVIMSCYVPPDSGVITVIRTSKSAIFKRLMLDIGASLGYTDIIFIVSIPLAII